MLGTPFGKVKLLFDQKEVDYKLEPVSNSKVFPDIDGAYILRFEYVPAGGEHTLQCLLDTTSCVGDIESGERLEAISFYIDNGKITIGCEGSFGCPEEYGYDYDGDYTSTGLEIFIRSHTKTHTFCFGVAWLAVCSSEKDIQTWFAADPAFQATEQTVVPNDNHS